MLFANLSVQLTPCVTPTMLRSTSTVSTVQRRCIVPSGHASYIRRQFIGASFERGLSSLSTRVCTAVAGGNMSACRAAVVKHLDVCVFVALFLSYFYYFGVIE